MLIYCRAGCGNEYEVPVTQDQLDKWQGGALIQNVMPNLTPDQRELLISGTCGRCWDKMFKYEEE